MVKHSFSHKMKTVEIIADYNTFFFKLIMLEKAESQCEKKIQMFKCSIKVLHVFTIQIEVTSVILFALLLNVTQDRCNLSSTTQEK